MEGKLSQCDLILRHLQDYGYITAMEAVNEYGIMRLAARIANLRERGVPIISETASGKNRYGQERYYAVYRLGEVSK